MTRTRIALPRATVATRVLAWIAAAAIAAGATIGLRVAQVACLVVLTPDLPGRPDRPDRLEDLRRAAFENAATGALAAAGLLALGTPLAWIAARRLAGRFDPICTTNLGWVGGALAALVAATTLIAAQGGISSEYVRSGLATTLATILAPAVTGAFAFVAVWRLRHAGRPLAQVLTRALVVACVLNWQMGGVFALYWFVCAAHDEPMLTDVTPSPAAAAA
jgi:hypothetical protein